jgi:hypothetical protein
MKAFDPYRAWLGIPGNQRPPTYYQLLGLRPNETDPYTIEEAAIRRTSRIRMYQTSAYMRECVQLLNELAEAEATLVNPAKRQRYDAQLQEEEGEPTSPQPRAVRRSRTAPPDVALPAAYDRVGTAPRADGFDAQPSTNPPRFLVDNSPLGPTLWAAAYLGCLIIGGVIGFWCGR